MEFLKSHGIMVIDMASQIPTFMAVRDIFYKQRGTNFYHTVSYSVSEIPLAVVETIVFAGFIKCLTGLVGITGLFLLRPVMNQYRSSVFMMYVYKGADHCSDFDVYMVAHTILTKKTVRKDEAGSYALVATPKKSKSYNNGEAFVVEVKEQLYSGNAGVPRLVVLGAEHEETERDVGSAEGCQQLTMSGSVTALMGASCTGKTTLMDVTAGRAAILTKKHDASFHFHDQLSLEVFYLFDNLLLLKRGGETAFVGELGHKCHKLMEYFEAIPGTAPLPKGYNPATWMLVPHDAGPTDFVDAFKKSEEKRILDADLVQEDVTIPSPNYPEMVFTQKARSEFVDAGPLSGGLIHEHVLAHAVTYQGINGGLGMVFMTTLFNGIVSFNSVLPISCEERESFYRERAAQTYNALWYFVGSTLVEIPYVFASGFIFTFVWFFMVGFTDFDTALLYWINVSLLILLQTYMGQFLAYALPSVEVAAIIGLYTITSLRYPLAILGSLVFGQCDVDPTWNESMQVYENVGSQLGCQPVTGLPVSIDHITIKEYVGSVFGMYYSDMWASFGYVFIFIVVFRVLAVLSLRFLNHQKR
ncbi:unnamed protein product [Peronospora destructor]|uniref:ABC transporter domain-containing protein n=1 Tax=Peronospora destructor TaxID=86335 RepID=A0AAV0T913_9STRA|nr:unnamed protein product [Peronospora destructor]